VGGHVTPTSGLQKFVLAAPVTALQTGAFPPPRKRGEVARAACICSGSYECALAQSHIVLRGQRFSPRGLDSSRLWYMNRHRCAMAGTRLSLAQTAPIQCAAAHSGTFS